MPAAPPRWWSTLLRLSGELIVIVIGVLIALSADAWFDERQERGAEVRHLEALREDIVATQGILAESNEGRDRLSAALVRLSVGDLGAVPPDSASRWVYAGLFSLENFEPRLTALTDLQNSDQLRVLTPDVRRDLAELDRVLDELQRVRDDLITSQQNLLDPYLVANVPLAPVLTLADSLPLATRLPARPDWSALETAQLQNAIAFKLSLIKLDASRRVELAEQLSGLVEVIEARLVELGRGAG